jgi:hypothetical protein
VGVSLAHRGCKPSATAAPSAHALTSTFLDNQSSAERHRIDCSELGQVCAARGSPLRDRRPRALRRHTKGVATRFAVLLAGDCVAVLLARSLPNVLIDARDEIGSRVLKAHALISKRIVDVIVSAVVLVVLAPILLIIAVAVRLDSPRPALF